MKFIPKFIAEDGTTIEFHPVNDVPGFTHRVVINGQAVRDWLGHGKPSAKAAHFFYDKHCRKAGETQKVTRSNRSDTIESMRHHLSVLCKLVRTGGDLGTRWQAAKNAERACGLPENY